MTANIVPVMRVPRSAWLVVGVLLLCGNAGAQLSPDQATALCTACHRDKFETTVSNPHEILDSAEWRTRTGNAPRCLNCHGNVDQHIGAGGGRGNVFAFRDESPSAKNDRCRTCHSNSHPEFNSGALAQGGLTCAGCHSQHGADASAAALLRHPHPAADLAGVTGTSHVVRRLSRQDRGRLLLQRAPPSARRHTRSALVDVRLTDE